MIKLYAVVLNGAILSLIYMLFGFILLANGEYSNYWLLKIDGDAEHANRLARDNNFRVIKPIGIDGGYYVLKADHTRIRRFALDSNTTTHDLINEHSNRIKRSAFVQKFHREKNLIRKKRDFIVEPRNLNYVSSSDPMWNDMWYLNRHLIDKQIPDMNVSGAWALGYTGRGVSVTFLDDGLERVIFF